MMQNKWLQETRGDNGKDFASFTFTRCDLGTAKAESVVKASAEAEIICGDVVTNNLATQDLQKEFIKAMAPYFCPDTDKQEVVDWVNSNVGSNINTVIGNSTYTLELGPANNLLYRAGYDEWGKWDLLVRYGIDE